MLEIYQKTIKKSVNFQGVGLHTGEKSKVTIHPANEDCGIIFKRIDLKSKNTVKANYKNVSSAKLCTTLENKYGVKVSTVEHLLAALYISEIDNAIIEINNEEVPIMDGSAYDFIETLRKAEIKKLSKKRKYIKILNKVELTDGERKISIEPNPNTFEVEFHLNYKNEIIGTQSNSINFSKDDLQDIYKSRTFCLFEDIEKIKKMGLAKGGSLENAIVVDKNKVLNKSGLRNSKEFVNHKILDLAGDFLLSGNRILGKVICKQGGHELSNLFLKKLFKSNTNFVDLEIKDIVIPEKINTSQSIKIAASA
tara:strand:- start:5830 stop:6756 length:927 start_codon:yes stop_codon:yes gene_type:complete